MGCTQSIHRIETLHLEVTLAVLEVALVVLVVVFIVDVDVDVAVLVVVLVVVVVVVFLELRGGGIPFPLVDPLEKEDQEGKEKTQPDDEHGEQFADDGAERPHLVDNGYDDGEDDESDDEYQYLNW